MLVPSGRVSPCAGGNQVSAYRLYFTDGLNHIFKAEWIEAKSDEEAIAEAKLHEHPHSCELWNRQRFVTKIDGHRER